MEQPTAPRAASDGFGIDELFFSTTDPKGRIVAGNAVFERVSGYRFDELSGRAHNIVRHPDMPRLVFRILWEHLNAGEPVAAYVKNRTKDGRPYWVVATATPSPGGFLSVRFKPSGPHFPVVEDVYRELLAVERGIESAGGSRAEAMDASQVRLDELLAGLGIAGYDALMRTFLPAEIRSREAMLEGSAYWDTLWRGSDGAGTDARGRALAEMLEAFRAAYARMQRLFENLEDYVRLNEALTARSRDLTGDTRLLSLNALMAASRLGASGATLSAVAGMVGKEADRAGALTTELNRQADELHGRLSDVGVRIAIGRLHAEMAVFFALETIRHGGPSDEVVLLSEVLSASMRHIQDAGAALAGELGGVRTQMTRLADLLHVLAVLQLNGTIEASRTAEAAGVHQLFAEMRDRVHVARTELVELSAVAATARARVAADDITGADAVLEHMRHAAATLASTC